MDEIYIAKNDPTFINTKEEILVKISECYENYINKLFPENVSKINSVEKLKYIISYYHVLLCSSYEIAHLASKDWFTSLESLTRDVLECYSIIKSMIRYYYDDSKFDEYIKYLFIKDMDQTIFILKLMQSDNTIDLQKREDGCNLLFDKLKIIINTHFPDKSNDIDTGKMFESISSIIKSLKKKYSGSDLDVSNYQHVAEAMKHNTYWNKKFGKDYEGSDIIYSTLCHSSHSTISSIIERTSQHNRAMLNVPSKNTLWYLNTCLSTIKDIYMDIEKICASI